MTSPFAPYSQDELHHVGEQRTFSGAALGEIAFPLGGIGTGTISLGGRGDLRDFEINGHPDKGNLIPFTFFALWARAAGQAPVARVLEGQLRPPFRDPNGELVTQLRGVPRFSEATFRGEYPAAVLSLTDDAVPVRATLEAWNPFIPLNVDDSALPIAIFEWTFTNDSDTAVEISLAASSSNPVTPASDTPMGRGQGSLNNVRHDADLHGIDFVHPDTDPATTAHGTMSLTTPWHDTELLPQWYRGRWWDRSHIFWDAFSATGRAPDVAPYAEPATRGDVASVLLHATVPAHGSITLPVYLSWHFAKLENPWRFNDASLPTILDTYQARFTDAWAVAAYTQANIGRLKEETGRFRRAAFGSTLPAHVLEAITSQASILRTNTCMLLKDGSFFGWEGSHLKVGSCAGSCTHVWNYEQALAFLFPQLERTMRRTEFLHSTRDSGHMVFRTNLPPGGKRRRHKPCVDGQMGVIIQLYRDWQLSGDDDFLRDVWPDAKRALEYAWTMTPEKMAPVEEGVSVSSGSAGSYDSLWDPDKDGVMEGEQHNTYDIEFFGPNPLSTVMYLGALRAAEALARHLGENEKADEYRGVYESGRAKVEANLWNGEYYIQKTVVIPEVEVCPPLRSPDGSGEAPIPKYQHGDGCLSDQLLGQWAAHVAGLGYLLDPERVRTALRSIFQYNFRAAVGGEHNVQRVFALNDEPGLLLCSWPHGNRPALPFVYCDEVWTGIEYQVAAHLIYEGLVDAGLTIVKGVADRYAGHNRNPWNQVECGFHYARAMASWSVKLALDGFRYSVPHNMLGFAPHFHADNFQTFWSTGTGWGSYHQQPAAGHFELAVGYGTQKLARLELSHLPAGEITVQSPHGSVSATRDGNAIVLSSPLILNQGEVLTITAAQP